MWDAKITATQWKRSNLFNLLGYEDSLSSWGAAPNFRRKRWDTAFAFQFFTQRWKITKKAWISQKFCKHLMVCYRMLKNTIFILNTLQWPVMQHASNFELCIRTNRPETASESFLIKIKMLKSISISILYKLVQFSKSNL